MSWRFEHSADSTAAPAEIWRRYADVEHWSDWSPGVQSSRLDGPFEVGSKGKSKPPGTPALRFRITSVEPQVKFVTEFRFPGARMPIEHVIEPISAGARITHRASLSGPLASLYVRTVRKRTEQNLTDSVERLAALAADKLAPHEQPEPRGSSETTS